MTPAEHAAWLVEDALRGLEPAQRASNTPMRVWRSYLMARMLSLPYRLVLFGLLLLTYCEVPLWCLRTGDSLTRLWTYAPPGEVCPAPDGSFIYLSTLPYVPIGWGVAIELVCYVLVWLLLRQMTLHDAQRGEATIVSRLRVLAVVVALLDTACFAIHCFSGVVMEVRVAPYMRLLLLCTLPSVLEQIVLLPRVLRHYGRILLLLLGFILLTAWVLLLMLDDNTAVVPRCAAETAAAAAAASSAGGAPTPAAPTRGTAAPAPVAALVAGAGAAAPSANPQAALQLLQHLHIFKPRAVVAADGVNDTELAAQLATAGAQACEAVNEGYTSLPEAFYRVVMSATTTDTPAEAVNMVAWRRPLSLLWLGFYFMSIFVLVNLILAVVYEEYSSALKERILVACNNRFRGLGLAYAQLRRVPSVRRDNWDQQGQRGVDFSQVIPLFGALNKAHSVAISGGLPYLPPTHWAYMAAIMDTEQSGVVSLNEFYDLLDVLQYSYVAVRRHSYLQRRFPRTWDRLNLDVVKWWVADTEDLEDAHQGLPPPTLGLQRIILVVMIVNFGTFAVESWQDLANSPTPLGPRGWAQLNMTFSFVYLANVALNLLVIPFDRYWLRYINRFDLIVSVGLAIVSALYLIGHLPPQSMRYVNHLRLLVLLKPVASARTNAFISKAIVLIVTSAWQTPLLLLLLTTLWSVVGVHAYGGRVYAGNAAVSDTDYFASNLDVFNMNDVPSATLLFLMCVLVPGTPQSYLTPVYGVTSIGLIFSYYYVVIMVIVNIFAATIINAYTAALEHNKNSDALEETLNEMWASHSDPEFEVRTNQVMNMEMIYKNMFGDDMEKIRRDFAEGAEKVESRISADLRASRARQRDSVLRGSILAGIGRGRPEAEGSSSSRCVGGALFQNNAVLRAAMLKQKRNRALAAIKSYVRMSRDRESRRCSVRSEPSLGERSQSIAQTAASLSSARQAATGRQSCLPGPSLSSSSCAGTGGGAAGGGAGGGGGGAEAAGGEGAGAGAGAARGGGGAGGGDADSRPRTGTGK